jgi:hypothetical protein
VSVVRLLKFKIGAGNKLSGPRATADGSVPMTNFISGRCDCNQNLNSQFYAVHAAFRFRQRDLITLVRTMHSI